MYRKTMFMWPFKSRAPPGGQLAHKQQRTRRQPFKYKLKIQTVTNHQLAFPQSHSCWHALTRRSFQRLSMSLKVKFYIFKVKYCQINPIQLFFRPTVCRLRELKHRKMTRTRSLAGFSPTSTTNTLSWFMGTFYPWTICTSHLQHLFKCKFLAWDVWAPSTVCRFQIYEMKSFEVI